MFSIQLPVIPTPTLGITIRWQWTFGIIFQLNNLYFLPSCTPDSVAFWNEVCLWFVRVWEREPGAGQLVARDQTLQPNNIHNIHQICIYYLTGILSILQMCTCVWKGLACKVPVLTYGCVWNVNVCMFFGFVCWLLKYWSLVKPNSLKANLIKNTLTFIAGSANLAFYSGIGDPIWIEGILGVEDVLVLTKSRFRTHWGHWLKWSLMNFFFSYCQTPGDKN